ncbi:hypothetical protein [Halomonas sp. HAL1]|uniref:hypothetical protein n=1 Tax=Halomonas sp. HAL1 TaxID=550984 RepID=UPI00022D34AF|nr:hypothetical protein [Halomonas sp. HAL1]EHA16767.1 hypothetical protein HAL1_04576 [Halomonas sp. HAL1]WKV94744.1 hypothetical protein Q3Y66_09020 [Halomonas sp. HAL1]
MTKKMSLQTLVAAHINQRNSAAIWALVWLLTTLCIFLIGQYSEQVPFNIGYGEFTAIQIALFITIAPMCLVLKKAMQLINYIEKLRSYKKTKNNIILAMGCEDVKAFKCLLAEVEKDIEKNELIKLLVADQSSQLNIKRHQLEKKRLQSELDEEVDKFVINVNDRIVSIKNELPVFKALIHVNESLQYLIGRREELVEKWEAAYKSFSWWNKLKYIDGLDLSELDCMISDLKFKKVRLESKHKKDFLRLENHLDLVKARASQRVEYAKVKSEEYINDHVGKDGIDSGILQKSLWFSALTIPVSIWSDVDQTSDVFDALREVNGQFADMSDTEIWWETIFLSSESLAGLAALTKGAYFEQLVAADTGGMLHEFFNHPGTDVVIDGIEFQLKATDSASYVNSVADDIPVIATSEVAFETGAIDSGYTNEELDQAVDLALGGSVVDFGDTAVDAILAGVGGLGVLATLKGINHAVSKHENGGDGVEAIFEGAGIAIEGTARALVGVAEMGYNVASSRPSRFVGRIVLKGLVKLDEKMMGDGGKH